MRRLALAVALIASLQTQAQQTDKLEFSLAGGVKQNVFRNVKSEIAAFNITQGYDVNLVTPNVKNTTSFFTSLKTLKRVSNRFAVTNTFGLDMQQLSIESGFKRRVAAPGVTGFSRETTTELLPRLKIDFGFDYSLAATRKSNFSIGLNAGQMLRLTSNGYNYSFVGAKLEYNTGNLSFFASGSATPYNVRLPNMQSYFGNLNADVVGNYEHRIVDAAVGAAIRIN